MHQLTGIPCTPFRATIYRKWDPTRPYRNPARLEIKKTFGQKKRITKNEYTLVLKAPSVIAPRCHCEGALCLKQSPICPATTCHRGFCHCEPPEALRWGEAISRQVKKQ